jgi:HTH-type transcriptional regulator / antitoxin HipB
MNAQKLGEMVRRRRSKIGLNQSELAMTAGTGRRFISELENGKDTCELGKALRVLTVLGIDLIRCEDPKGGDDD